MTGDLPLYGPGWDEFAALWRKGAREAFIRHGDAALREARESNRRKAQRFLDSFWTRALRGPVEEPHAAEGWDSGVRLAVAEAMAGRLARQGVDPDLAVLLVAGWGSTYCEPPLTEDEAAVAVARRFRTRREAA